jgi:hypothetical protein
MFRTGGLIESIEQEPSFAVDLLCVIVRKMHGISSLTISKDALYDSAL